MAFLTIEPGPGLSPSQRRKAGRRGPPSVLVRGDYPSLLRSAGFVDIDVTDVTAEYRDTQRAWRQETERRREELVELVGVTEYEEGCRNRRRTTESIGEGLLRRRLYVARNR